MIDPGALGTVVIGLDRIRRENAWIDQPTDTRTVRTRRQTRGRGPIRLAVAAALRRLADALSPEAPTQWVPAPGGVAGPRL